MLLQTWSVTYVADYTPILATNYPSTNKEIVVVINNSSHFNMHVF